MSATKAILALLRLRKVQAEQIKIDVASANAVLRNEQKRAARVRRELGDAHLSDETMAAWTAAVARRSALVSDLESARALVARAELDLGEKQAAWARARRAERSLERVVERHERAQEEAALRADQKALDDRTVAEFAARARRRAQLEGGDA
ncbi:flagellar FliJ family protein [Kineococcus sp. NPDC059986]|uniref:flagellar FliJ family protein n=1 Tax=Kineococcus sp. NPDC059986 TaxID=3155538 RepID=UPI00344EB679